MADSAAIAPSSVAASNAREQEICWQIFKQQVRLTAGLLRSGLLAPGQQDRQRRKNQLHSPLGLCSALATLIPGTETDLRAQLSRILLRHDLSSGINTNEAVDLFCRINKKNTKKNEHSLRIANFLYSHPSCPIKPRHVTKLTRKYRAAGVSILNFGSSLKPNLEALQLINLDQQTVAASSDCLKQSPLPMMSNLEYATHVTAPVRTILSSSVHFHGLWSRPLEVRHGEFRTGAGHSVKTPFLYRRKKLTYYQDLKTMSSAVKINFRHDGNLCLVLILPHESISIEQYALFYLNYQSLKQILKSLHAAGRTDVALTLPQLSLHSSLQTQAPIRNLSLRALSEAKLSKKPDYLAGLDDHLLLLQRCSLELTEQGVNPPPLPQPTAPPTFAGSGDSENRSKLVEFTADRPFIFLLLSKSDERAIVMAGVCQDPRD